MLEGLQLAPFVGAVCRLSQRRSRDKPSPTLPLWSACSSNVGLLLPYLATRTTGGDNVTREDLSPIAQGSESPLLGLSMGLVGSGSITWFFMGRYSAFGGLDERWTSFIDLMSIDGRTLYCRLGLWTLSSLAGG
jgi:hypothetical protein